MEAKKRQRIFKIEFYDGRENGQEDLGKKQARKSTASTGSQGEEKRTSKRITGSPSCHKDKEQTPYGIRRRNKRGGERVERKEGRKKGRKGGAPRKKKLKGKEVNLVIRVTQFITKGCWRGVSLGGSKEEINSANPMRSAIPIAHLQDMVC